MNKVKLSTFSLKNNIDKGAGPLKRIMWNYVNIIFLQSNWLPFSGIKAKLLRLFGAKIGKGVQIKPNVNIKRPWRLTIGDYCWIGEGVWIDNNADVVIESNCVLSQGVMILCGNHNYKKSSFDTFLQPVTIKEGAWICAKAVIAPGVTINTHAILGVGAVTTKDLEAYGIYSGNPAVKVKERVIE